MEQKHLATSRKSDFLIIRKNHPKLDYSWAISCTYKAPSTCSPPIHSSLEWWLGGWLGQWHYSPLMQQVAAPFWHTLAFSLEKNQRRMHVISEKHSAITSQQPQSSPCSFCLSSTKVLKVFKVLFERYVIFGSCEEFYVISLLSNSFVQH